MRSEHQTDVHGSVEKHDHWGGAGVDEVVTPGNGKDHMGDHEKLSGHNGSLVLAGFWEFVRTYVEAGVRPGIGLSDRSHHQAGAVGVIVSACGPA